MQQGRKRQRGAEGKTGQSLRLLGACAGACPAMGSLGGWEAKGCCGERRGLSRHTEGERAASRSNKHTGWVCWG